MRQIKCSHCKKKLGDRRRVRFCSAECQTAHRRTPNKPRRLFCTVCGHPFSAVGGGNLRYCEPCREHQKALQYLRYFKIPLLSEWKDAK
nr:MAG TPA: zinc-ribbon domain protein [Caudoviricetes sp.]